MSDTSFQPFLGDQLRTEDNFQLWPDRDEKQLHVSAETIDEYARGMAEGQQLASAAFAEERIRLQKLLASAEALQPVDTDTIRNLLYETIERLVSQIVGQTPTDSEWLMRQIEQAVRAAAQIDSARTIWLHPDDLELLTGFELGIALKTDPMLVPGSLRLETDSGWIEHGRMILLDAMRSELGGGGGK
ncbi:flagellar biosynthetic protein [Sphingorhabdus pulchriflava]|uniref:Flagellar biosynthetic protein n=1 Tax=Sphingorhabdus pulchriflava TaxID=2292257 RepID=A0A371B580_9SPHN|nr:FliH/SctL family protein [Sphingorhabdus pulchriflava]RDV02704.1 flagellar biosynthetic protein [Sphingorhabdus pulchriflava]